MTYLLWARVRTKEVFSLENTFKEAFRNFIDARALDYAEIAARCDPWHRELSNKVSQLHKLIRDNLGENKDLIGEYESSINLLGGIESEFAYKFGLNDGILLKKELDISCPAEQEISFNSREGSY